jgi:hypothetical protein
MVALHKLVRSQQDLLTMVALHNLKLLLHRLELVIGIHGFHGVQEGWQLGPLKFSKLVYLLRLQCLLVRLHVGHSLLQGLEHLSLHHQNLLQGQHGWRWWIGSTIVLSIVVLSVDNMVPCIGHLKNR